MIKSSFAVGYRINRVTKVVLGVTSIVPNLNGVLLRVENGEDIQVEKYELTSGDFLANMFISYEEPSSFEGIFNWEVIDRRKQ